ncbi:hypothetical protein OQA88_9305 [Cercophora sp. LCS_1]
MEVLGVVAAVPGLLEIIAKTATLVQDCASSNRLSNVTKGLDCQLNLLRSTFAEIDKGWKARYLPPTELRELNPVLKELREELEALNKLLTYAVAPNLLRRVKMSLFGFEKKLKEHVLRIEQIKSLLALKMTTGIHASVTDASTSYVSRQLEIKGILRDELESRGCVSALFCFWGQSESQRKCASMVSTLLWQLMKALPEPDFEMAAQHIISNLPLSTTDILKAIGVTVEKLRNNVHLIIDGIDESTDEWDRADRGGFEIISRLVTSCKNVHILVLGRQPALSPLLKSFPGVGITPGLVRADIN